MIAAIGRKVLQFQFGGVPRLISNVIATRGDGCLL